MGLKELVIRNKDTGEETVFKDNIKTAETLGMETYVVAYNEKGEEKTHVFSLHNHEIVRYKKSPED